MRLLRCRLCRSFSLLAASTVVLLLLATGWLSLWDGAKPAKPLSGDQLEAINRVETRPAFSEMVTSLERAVMLELLETADRVFKHSGGRQAAAHFTQPPDYPAMPDTEAAPVALQSTSPAATTSRQPLPTLPAFMVEARRRVRNVKLFQPFPTRKERWIMLNLLQTIDRVFKHYNVTYIIYGGTLLGSHRHMGFIPWDDDIDLLVNKTNRQRIPKMLKQLAPSLTLYEAGGHDKISHGLSLRTNQYPWRWPYLDVGYFEENSTHIWDHMMTYAHWFVYPKLLTLPLHSRPFEHLWLPAPRDTLAFLQVTYGRTGTCLTSAYSHMIENGMPSGRKPCVLLRHSVPFVHRWPCPNGDVCVHETLQLGARTMRSNVTVAEPPFAVNDPFSLRLRPGFTQPPDYPAMPDTDL